MSPDADKPTAKPKAPSALANPVLIGAMTMLVTLVAVFLAYNANAGLPFLPTRELKVDIASGSDLVVGNEVDEGGFRVGLVSAMQPIILPTGQVAAQLTLKIDKAHWPIPTDSTATILPRSVLGLKYVQIHVGAAKRVFQDGGTMPIANTTVPVQFEDIFQMFDARTRTAIDNNLVGFGDALAARGSSLNDTISSLPALLGNLRPVAQYLAAPHTELVRFLGAMEGFMSTVSPVAQTNALLFTKMATTFEAISRSPADLEATIQESPSTESVSTTSLRIQQPFLVDLSTLGHEFTPAFAELHRALPDLNPAIEDGTATLKRTPPLNSRLQDTMDALQQLSEAPGTNVAINALDDTVTTLNPMVRYLGPFQTVCDDWNYLWTYLSEHISEQTQFGFAQRVLLNQGNPLQPNNVSSQGAYAPADGYNGAQSPTGGSTPANSPTGGGVEFLHGQNYQAAVDNEGNADCESGQYGYPLKINYFDPEQRDLALDPHTPGDQGATFAGEAHVPAGETFTREPQTGPQLPDIPGNN